MRNLTLHIGRHKSGTSTIQSVLANNSKLLLDNGYYYPEFGRRGKAHHLLSEPLSRGQLRGRRYEDVWGGLNKQLSSELKGFSEDIVISSEAFQNCDPVVVKSAFSSFDCKVIVYLREQCSYLLSAYSQKVQATDYSESIECFYENNFHINYEKFLNQWSEQFKSKVDVRVFDRNHLKGNDVVVDFFVDVLGVSVKDINNIYTGSDSNPSLSPRMLAFKVLLNRTGPLPGNIRLDVYKVLGGMSKSDGSGSVSLSPSLAEKVLSDHRNFNQNVAREYFDRDVLFDEFSGVGGSLYELDPCEITSITEHIVCELPESARYFENMLCKISA